jgi:hypothetical protein
VPELSHTLSVTNDNVRISKKPKALNIPFDAFWNLYDKKADRKRSEKAWGKLTNKERVAVMEYIPRYIQARPDKLYRKNPITFLNNRSWEDEIIGKPTSKPAYGDLLNDPRWQRKRLEVFQRDNFSCQLCGDTETELQVHHKKYINGRQPWDYEPTELITLCVHCHKKIS